jgi:hypothetical protein
MDECLDLAERIILPRSRVVINEHENSDGQINVGPQYIGESEHKVKEVSVAHATKFIEELKDGAKEKRKALEILKSRQDITAT